MVSVGLENCQRDPGNFHLQIHTQSHTPLSEFIRKGVYLLMSPFSLLWFHLLRSPLLAIVCSSLLVFRFILYFLVSFWSGLRNLFAYVFSSSLLVSFFVFWFSVPPLLSDSSLASPLCSCGAYLFSFSPYPSLFLLFSLSARSIPCRAIARPHRASGQH